MIRFLILVVVFVTGLVAALIYQGRLHHLEMAFPGKLPEWTAQISPDAGVRRGSMRFFRGGGLPDLTLDWTARLPNLEGWHWRLRLTGDGVDISADLTLDHWPEQGRISDGTGTVDLARLTPRQPNLTGVLSLALLDAVGTDLMHSPVFQGDLAGTLGGVTAQDADFGQGPVTGVLEANGAWRLDVQLQGGVSPVKGQLIGQVPKSLARLDLTIEDGQELPDILRGVVSSIGQVDGAGWRVTADVPVF